MLLLETGTANLASVRAAFRRLGVEPRPGTDPAAVRDARHVVLPGVGTFGAAMARLRERGLDDALRERVAAGRPLLAVCVGLQLLCEGSGESPGVDGLGIVPARVTRFEGAVRVPHMGWTRVTPTPGARWLRDGFAYFANSYRLPRVPEGFEGATADHGGPFVAALQRVGLLALQCHPELSGAWGAALLRAWLEEA